jgi:hypothetical protein
MPTRITEDLQNEWARFPKPRERFCGLTRTTLREMADQGLFRVAVYRKPGANRSIRLIHVPSLRAALNNLADAACPSQTTGTPSGVNQPDQSQQ